MDASFCRFGVIFRVSRVRIRVSVGNRVSVVMPVLEYGYGKNVRTATDGKNGLPVLYTPANPTPLCFRRNHDHVCSPK